MLSHLPKNDEKKGECVCRVCIVCLCGGRLEHHYRIWHIKGKETFFFFFVSKKKNHLKRFCTTMTPKDGASISFFSSFFFALFLRLLLFFYDYNCSFVGFQERRDI